MTDTLSIKDAQKLVLLSQWLPPARPVGPPLAATLSAIEHLGYIQIDTISAVQRAHHHTLWSRNPRYAASHLDRLVADKQVFEYWSHAAAYLPMRDYRFSLPRKHAIASGAQRHWHAPDVPLMQTVLKRIAAEGPLMAKDFEHTGGKLGEWKSKPAKRALESLFMQGELMLPRRERFHKVYDLTERVLPEGIDTRLPTPEAHARFLITRYLQANGLGQAAEICYLQNNMKPRVSAMLNEMASCGEVVPVHVGQHRYYALPASLALLSKPLRRSRLSILILTTCWSATCRQQSASMAISRSPFCGAAPLSRGWTARPSVALRCSMCSISCSNPGCRGSTILHTLFPPRSRRSWLSMGVVRPACIDARPPA